VIVGLTGGICTGKSTAAKALQALGVHVIDCDLMAHFLADHDPIVRERILAQFGDEAFLKYGALDRQHLASKVFSSRGDREALETILHPPILTLVDANLLSSRCTRQDLVVVIPLLFELQLQDKFDETWMIRCSLTTQLERLQQRRGYSPEEAKQRIAAQWPLDKKAALATRVLNNDATIADFESTIVTTWESLKTA
jgi:dephospho-CoA kinase